MARLIYLMGASGSGKDTLLASLKQPSIHEKPMDTPLHSKNKILVAHRYITRDISHQSENHIALSEEEFLFRKEAGLFALDWQANGLFYGIGLEIDTWIGKGHDVIINGSRAHLEKAKHQYGEQLIAVCLQVSKEALKQRLTQRGRETYEEIALRLLRAERYATALPSYTHFIDNEGDIESSLHQLKALIRLVNTTSKGERATFEDV